MPELGTKSTPVTLVRTGKFIEHGQLITAIAEFSQCERYRYLAQYTWDASKKSVCFIMLNPSTATELKLDPTLRRCKGFAQQWDYGTMHILNLYAYRTPYPEELWRAVDPYGAENMRYITDIAERHADLVVCAWGRHAKRERVHRVIEKLDDRGLVLYQIGTYPYPRHPLMLSYNEPLTHIYDISTTWRNIKK